MEKHISYEKARALVLEIVQPVEAERLPLARCAGRVLAQSLTAAEDVPAFDRSPYDGYAFRAQDVQEAGEESPVELRVLEEIPAGGISHCAVTEGTAVKVLTGAPIPPGADAVVKYESTRFTKETVTIFKPAKPGQNIVRAGEDVKEGQALASPGTVIDAALMGVLAAQRQQEPLVYRVPKVGLITTGEELLSLTDEPRPGKIYDTSRYTLAAALEALGCEPVWLGWAGDDVGAISGLIEKGLGDCDALVLTGGVSAGDYDLTPDAMEGAGVKLLFRGVDFKPGMACAYGVGKGKPVCALSGNPAAALTNFYAIAAPALRKLRGLADYMPQEVELKLASSYPKKSPMTRLLRGRLKLTEGRVELELPPNQGNAVLISAVGWNVMAVVPAGSGALEAGTTLKGFLL